MNYLTRIFNKYYEGLTTRGSFTQNFAVTFSGNVLAQFLGILFTPFIARIYGPATYGVFALFIGLVNNLLPISTLQLPTGYVAAEDDREFFGVLKITSVSVAITTLLCILIVWFSGDWLTTFFHVTEFRSYLIWIPVYLMFMALDNMLLGWNIRIKEFKRSAVAKVFSISSSKIATLLMGVLSVPSAGGMILGNLITYPVEIVLKSGRAIRHSAFFSTLKDHTWHDLLLIAKKYRQYILFVTPGVFVVNFSNLLPIYFFSRFFTEREVGYFALASSMVSLPLSLIINSSTTVFLQKAAEVINRSKTELSTLVSTLYRKLFLLGFLPLVVLSFTSRWLFILVFGPEWERAGVFVSYLCIAASFNVVHGPLSVLFRLMHLERINFLTNLLFFILKLLGLSIGLIYNDIMLSIIGFSVASLISQVMSITIIFRAVNLPLWTLVRDTMLAFVFMTIIIWVNR